MPRKTASDYAEKYTRPGLRERLKEQIKASSKGGRKGQWSARKSQRLVQEYEREGGGYKGGKRESQKSLEQWGKEQWQTRSGDARARHGETTERYLPKKAWERLSPEEREKTDRRKRRASRQGTQHVADTPAAKNARRAANRDVRHEDLAAMTKAQLMERAEALDIRGRSSMRKSELLDAVTHAAR